MRSTSLQHRRWCPSEESYEGQMQRTLRSEGLDASHSSDVSVADEVAEATINPWGHYARSLTLYTALGAT
jgi:hypothetical protein